jgi:hypothetical protein
MIINNTPHPINIIDPKDIHFDANIRKYVAPSDTTPILTIPSSGILNARISTVGTDPVDSIPCFDKRIDGCDPLPDDGAIHIVSALYASAAAKAGFDMSRIMLVADPVMSTDGKTFIGCRGLAKAF